MKIELDLKSLGIGFALGTAPFWLMATTPDWSEGKSQIIGAVLVGAIGALFKKRNTE